VTLLQGIEQLASNSTGDDLTAALCRRFADARRRGPRAASRGAARPGSPGAPACEPKRPRSAPTLRARPPTAEGRTDAAALGPAAGKFTVQEQRAKLLFELSRAQARAAAQAGAARHTGDVARLAEAEVARLGAAVRDLDRRFRPQLDHATGALDGQARVPWQHVGPGTHAADPHPERLGRPWDGPAVDETFAPRISGRSREIMSARGGGGGGGAAGGGSTFLDRLAADERRRAAAAAAAARRRAAGPAAAGLPAAAAVSSDADAMLSPQEAQKRAKTDAALLARVLGTRWGVALPGGADLAKSILAYSQTGQSASAAAGEAAGQVEAALNEVVEAYAKELMLSPRRKAALLAERGRAKAAGVAAAVRTMEFIERYKSDLRTRDARLADLQARFFAAAGRGGPGEAEARDGRAADAWFAQLGWRDAGEW
jgi:hypothetical protein